MDVRQILHETLLPRLEGVKSMGGYFMARCPVHEDREPSLAIKPGTTQPVLINCHAGCQTEDILAHINLTFSDISLPEEERERPSEEWTPAGPASHVYDYRSESGRLVYQVLRVPQPGGKKTFRQRRPDASASGWKWNLTGVDKLLYRLPELIKALDGGEVVYIAEGEKDCEALVRAGVAATCNSGGAGRWEDSFTDYFVDAHVKIVSDCDDPGRAHARHVADQISEVAASVSILEPPSSKDFAEHWSKGGKLDDLLVTWTSERDQVTVLAPDLHEFLSVVDPPTSWVVPDLLERGDRLIWTGYEGLGKAWWPARSPLPRRRASTRSGTRRSPARRSSTSTARTPNARVASTSATSNASPG